MLVAMDDLRIGALVRAVRQHRGWRQVDLALAAAVSASLVSLIERGHFDTLALRSVRRVLAVLDIRLDMNGRWRGGDADRLLGARHSALHESLAQFFATLAGWIALPEVTFSIYGERGVIDILCWFPGRRLLLVIELKTELVDVQALLGQTDRYFRLAAKIAKERGWNPVSTSVWVVFSDTKTNRRHVAQHATVLRSVLPADGHAMRAWLRDPHGSIKALSFWSESNPDGASHRIRPRKRVRLARNPRATHNAAARSRQAAANCRLTPP
jgi:transcriptional regulator with XRE-family HTH domain